MVLEEPRAKSKTIQNLFDDEDRVVEQLTLQHRMKDSEQRDEMRVSISERYDDGDALPGEAARPRGRPRTPEAHGATQGLFEALQRDGRRGDVHPNPTRVNETQIAMETMASITIVTDRKSTPADVLDAFQQKALTPH